MTLWSYSSKKLIKFFNISKCIQKFIHARPPVTTLFHQVTETETGIHNKKKEVLQISSNGLFLFFNEKISARALDRYSEGSFLCYWPTVIKQLFWRSKERITLWSQQRQLLSSTTCLRRPWKMCRTELCCWYHPSLDPFRTRDLCKRTPRWFMVMYVSMVADNHWQTK